MRAPWRNGALKLWGKLDTLGTNPHCAIFTQTARENLPEVGTAPAGCFRRQWWSVCTTGLPDDGCRPPGSTHRAQHSGKLCNWINGARSIEPMSDAGLPPARFDMRSHGRDIFGSAGPEPEALPHSSGATRSMWPGLSPWPDASCAFRSNYSRIIPTMCGPVSHRLSLATWPCKAWLLIAAK